MTGPQTIQLPDGGFLNVRIDGPAGAPVLVFSNSVMTDMSVWDAQVADLQASFRVLRYDQRGHGQSSVQQGPLDFMRYGADLLQLLLALEVANCTYVGLSMGVPTGLVAYASAPQKFDGFVAVDGVSRSAPGREAFWRELRETARGAGMGSIAERTTPRWLPGTGRDDPCARKLAAMIEATPVEGFAAATYALQSYDFSDVVPQIGCPFLGIAGALDGAMPDSMHTQFAGVPGTRFVTIPACGHVPNFQSPEAFNATLRGFLQDVATPKLKEAN